MRAPLALSLLLAMPVGGLLACGSSTPVDINFGTDAGAGFDAPAREVHPSGGEDGSAGAGGESGAGGVGGESGAAGVGGESGAAGSAAAGAGGGAGSAGTGGDATGAAS
jgi:hypothetical protein